ILEFFRNPTYVELRWPDDYWPKSDAPSDAAAWDASVAGFQRDRAALQQLANDPAVDLFATIPHGSGQTYLRELILAIDHNAYHIGELVAVRRALGVWEETVQMEGAVVKPNTTAVKPDATPARKKIYDTILDAIGDTPMVRIDLISKGL